MNIEARSQSVARRAAVPRSPSRCRSVAMSDTAFHRRILLVEDEESLVLTLTDRLVSEGYVIESAGDGITALDRASNEQFDLILLDVALPGKNGFDVCRDLR